MIQAYNFLYSWQLFPEKGTYEKGDRPKSGIYKLSTGLDKKHLQVEMNWVTLENLAFEAAYMVLADGQKNEILDGGIAAEALVNFIDSINFEVQLFLSEGGTLFIHHEIMPNGYLKLTEKGHFENGDPYTNISVYHKQMSVLPYSNSVSGAVIRPTEEGMIRHKSLTAMEEQTNMQLAQIRQQIELLALQAQEIQKRKELSELIYNAKLSFTPVIGQVYYLYEKKDNSYFLSMVSPKEWGATGPFKKCTAAVKLLADHTWMEII